MEANQNAEELQDMAIAVMNALGYDHPGHTLADLLADYGFAKQEDSQAMMNLGRHEELVRRLHGLISNGELPPG